MPDGYLSFTVEYVDRQLHPGHYLIAKSQVGLGKSIIEAAWDRIRNGETIGEEDSANETIVHPVILNPATVLRIRRD